MKMLLMDQKFCKWVKKFSEFLVHFCKFLPLLGLFAVSLR